MIQNFLQVAAKMCYDTAMFVHLWDITHLIYIINMNIFWALMSSVHQSV